MLSDERQTPDTGAVGDSTAAESLVNDRWWESFYDDAFADVVMATGEDETARATAAFLVEKLQLQPGDTVFDQCCGLGRISIPLARQQIQIIGADLIESYVRRAAEAARAQQLSCDFFVGDAFNWVPPRPCDAAFNWASSFGYTDDDEQNRMMFQRAFEALTPGGRYALDYYSVPRLLREFQQSIRIPYRTEHGEFLVTRDAQVNFEAGVIEQQWTYRSPGGEEHRKRSATRMYMPHEIAALLRRCGFTDVEVYGGVDGSAFTLHSSRCVLVARKPG